MLLGQGVQIASTSTPKALLLPRQCMGGVLTTPITHLMLCTSLSPSLEVFTIGVYAPGETLLEGWYLSRSIQRLGGTPVARVTPSSVSVHRDRPHIVAHEERGSARTSCAVSLARHYR